MILAVDFILAGKLLCGYLRLPGWHGVLGRVMEVSGMGIGDGGKFEVRLSVRSGGQGGDG